MYTKVLNSALVCISVSGGACEFSVRFSIKVPKVIIDSNTTAHLIQMDPDTEQILLALMK